MGLVVGGPELWGMVETEQRLGDAQWAGNRCRSEHSDWGRGQLSDATRRGLEQRQSES